MQRRRTNFDDETCSHGVTTNRRIVRDGKIKSKQWNKEVRSPYPFADVELNATGKT